MSKIQTAWPLAAGASGTVPTRFAKPTLYEALEKLDNTAATAEGALSSGLSWVRQLRRELAALMDRIEAEEQAKEVLSLGLPEGLVDCGGLVEMGVLDASL